MKVRVCPVILSGGFGARLWPLSRESLPKQFLALTGPSSLLRSTAARLAALAVAAPTCDVLSPVVVSHESHRYLVEEHLAGRAATLIVEPEGRNTAPALTLAALEVQASAGDDAILVVSPSDHLILDESAFGRALARAVLLARDGAVVTLGISPTRAETGYGYLELGEPRGSGGASEEEAFAVASFVEKPDAATAAALVAGGRHLWNGGLFVLRASRWLSLIGELAPQIASACREAFSAASSAPPGASGVRVICPAAEAFARCPSDSIDYAVMEKLPAHGGELLVVPFSGGWSDVGDFAALAAVGPLDEHGNLRRGQVVAVDTESSVLLAQHRLLAVLGLRDAVVVETADAVLVTQRARGQDVKRLVAELAREQRPELVSSLEANRPWGCYRILDEGDNHRVKWLTVDPGERISLQLHERRAEHWVVVRGRAHITRGDKTFDLEVNQSTFIPVGVKHRIANLGTEPLEIIEVQCGSYIGEDDIVRFEDKYDRIKP